MFLTHSAHIPGSGSAFCRRLIRQLPCLALVALSVPTTQADTIYSQPQAAGLIASAWLPPDGSDADRYAWDTFTLTSAATITEIQWQGDGFGNGLGFAISITPSPTLPDPASILALYNVPGNAGQTPAGIVNGTQRYNYNYVLPKPLQLSAGTLYWINIEGTGGWNISSGSGGNGSHVDFIVGLAMFLLGPGDTAFTLIGSSSCVTPSVTAQPGAVALCGTGSHSASFTVASSGTGPFAYQWRKATVPMNTTANPSAATATLTLTNVSAADVSSYDCVVTNSCGNTTSNAAALTNCPADFNCSGAVTVQDIFDFLSAWFAKLPSADFNASAAVTVQDIFDFLGAWFAGCH